MHAHDDFELWPSDVVAFSPGVVLDGHLIIDRLTGKTHPVNDSAAQLLSAVDGKTSVAHCALFVAAENGWDWDTVTNDFGMVIDALEQDSLVHIRRRFWSRLQPENLSAAVGRFISLNWSRPAARRYVPSPWSLALACLRASRWGLMAGAAVSCILALVFSVQGLGETSNSWKLIFAYLPFLLILALVGHIILHEAGHLAAMNVLAPRQSKYVLVRGLRVSVAHAPLDPRTRRIVAISGPLAGLVGAQLIGIAFLFLPGLASLAAVVNLSGFLHLYSFCPWTADGRMIRKGGQ